MRKRPCRSSPWIWQACVPPARQPRRFHPQKPPWPGVFPTRSRCRLHRSFCRGRGREDTPARSDPPTGKAWPGSACRSPTPSQHAHAQGVLHRDIKPSNLLLDTAGVVWVTDFGLAKADDQQNLTHTGDVLGTLRYMPPEAFDGRTDARGDVYSLGLTLYELLALRPAFDEKERNPLIKQVTTSEPARLDRLNPNVPRDLVTIVHKAIEPRTGPPVSHAPAS